jgi:hypothetical protein
MALIFPERSFPPLEPEYVFSHSGLLPFIDSRSENVTSIPIIVGLAFDLVIYSAKVFPSLKHIHPNYFEEYTKDFQLPMGPTLSKGTVEEVHMVVVIYIPSIILFFLFLGSLIFSLRVPILESTSMLPSVIRDHTGRFVRAIQRRASLRP